MPIKRTISLAVVVSVGALVLGGCPQPAPSGPTGTFTEGTTAGVFGTIESSDGNTYEIEELDGDRLRVDTDGPAGSFVFEIDEQGRLVGATGPDGSTIDLTYNDDGSIAVSGTALVDGTPTPFSGTIPADQVPELSSKLLTAQAQDPLVVCVAIDAFCSLLPDIIDVVIGLAAAEFGISEDFPTGIEAVDGFVRIQVVALLPILDQVQDFCFLWNALEIAPCQ
jgi:hypothetical protein